MCTRCPQELARDVISAFPTFVAHHQDLVFGIARRSTGDHAEAEDLAQDVLLRAYRALTRYDRDRIAQLHIRGWVARIALNAARNRARSAAHDHARAAADLDAVAEPIDQRTPTPEQVVERRDAASMWRRLLVGLPAGYRTAVELRHVEGLSYPELAEALGRPLGTVKSDVHRGVRLLRRAYETAVAGDDGRPAHDGDGARRARTASTVTAVDQAASDHAMGRREAPEVMVR